MTTEACFRALGLEPGASVDEIKAAFRRLARTYHPDVAGPEGAPKFAEITEAYMTLKESISQGGIPNDGEVVQVERRSFFRTLFRKIASIFTFKRRQKPPTVESTEYENDLPPMRVKMISSLITRTEDEIHALMSRRGEMKDKAETAAILSRVSSRHPAVATMALKRVSLRDASPKLREGIVEHFRRTMPVSEVLETLLSVFSNTQLAIELARALSAHSQRFSETDANLLLKWYRRQDAPKECWAGMLMHPSEKIVAATLASWPPTMDLSGVSEVMGLLKSEDEAILVPLLRILKREKQLTNMVAGSILRIAQTTEISTVRVWAAAIVREKNLG